MMNTNASQAQAVITIDIMHNQRIQDQQHGIRRGQDGDQTGRPSSDDRRQKPGNIDKDPGKRSKKQRSTSYHGNQWKNPQIHHPNQEERHKGSHLGIQELDGAGTGQPGRPRRGDGLPDAGTKPGGRKRIERPPDKGSQTNRQK